MELGPNHGNFIKAGSVLTVPKLSCMSKLPLTTCSVWKFFVRGRKENRSAALQFTILNLSGTTTLVCMESLTSEYPSPQNL